MSNGLEVASYVLTAAVAVISLVIALVEGSKWEKNNPSKLGFRWGYFFVFNTLLGNGLLFLVLLFVAIDHGEFGFILFISGVIALLVFSAMNALKRRKWALVLMTLLSLNVLWIIINIFYFRNRWAEFDEERSERFGVDRENLYTEKASEDSDGVGLGMRTLSKSWRLAIFGAVSWVLAVIMFVVLFEPYGSYMGDDEFVHLFAVMFLPSGAALGLYWAYGRFVR